MEDTLCQHGVQLYSQVRMDSHGIAGSLPNASSLLFIETLWELLN